MIKEKDLHCKNIGHCFSVLCSFLLLTLIIFSGCQSNPAAVTEGQTGKLHIQVEVSQESLNILPSQMNGQYNGTISYEGVSNVCIELNGKSVPLEQAVMGGLCSIEEVTAWAREDARKENCVEGQCTYNGLTKFTYTYPDYMLVVIHDVYEVPDGNEYAINRFIVTTPKKLKPTPIGYSDLETGAYLDLEDWGVTFVPLEATDQGITLKTVQHDGQNFGSLYLTDFYLVAEPEQRFLEESQVYGLSIPIEMDGSGEFWLAWNDFIPGGDYTLVVRLEERYNKEDMPSLMRNYHDTQQYLIPISIS